MGYYDAYKVNLELGASGAWRLEQFVVSEEDAKRDALFAAIRGSARCVPPGTYTGLYCGNDIVMSDTPDEIRDHIRFINRAKGDVLINGLGLGMCALAVANKNEVNSVTVIEKSEDVINLVAHQINHPKITIIHADAYEWTPPKGKRYNVVWHDIWTYICPDNLPQMTKLHRKYARRCDWQGSWGKEICQRYQRYGY